MTLLRSLLVITAVASFVYGFGTLLLAGLFRDLGMAPLEDAWARYQLPPYLALGIVALAAYRDAFRSATVIWGLVAVWGTLAIVLAWNLVAGDESLNVLTVARLAFDSFMALALASAIRRTS